MEELIDLDLPEKCCADCVHYVRNVLGFDGRYVCILGGETSRRMPDEECERWEFWVR